MGAIENRFYSQESIQDNFTLLIASLRKNLKNGLLFSYIQFNLIVPEELKSTIPVFL